MKIQNNIIQFTMSLNQLFDTQNYFFISFLPYLSEQISFTVKALWETRWAMVYPRRTIGVTTLPHWEGLNGVLLEKSNKTFTGNFFPHMPPCQFTDCLRTFGLLSKLGEKLFYRQAVDVHFHRWYPPQIWVTLLQMIILIFLDLEDLYNIFQLFKW